MDIKIKVENLNEVLQDIEAFKKRFEENVTEMVHRATELGRSEASANFSSAQYDGTKDVNVTAKAYKKSGTVTASGESVLFIEFGTGISYPNDHPEASRLGIEHGSWSKGPEGKGHWDDPHGWYYAHGKRSWGNPANRCMYNAAKEVERNAERIAREVFK